MSKPNPRRIPSDPRSRTRRIAQLLVLPLVVLGLFPVSAFAVHVVDVRVGQHEKYTRLVFELDEPTGYRITRAGKAPRSSELEISLDAMTQPGRFSFPQGWIEKLDVRAVDDRLAASVALRKSGLRLREMTLDQPFRVVIDVLAPPAPPVAKQQLPKKKNDAAVATKKSAPAAKQVSVRQDAPETKRSPAARVTPAAKSAQPRDVAPKPDAGQPVAKNAAVVDAAPAILAGTKSPPAAPKQLAAAQASAASLYLRARGAPSLNQSTRMGGSPA